MWNWIRSLIDKIAIRRRVRTLRDVIVNWWRQLDAVPYVTIFDVPRAYLLPDRSVGDIKGLLVVALRESAADRQVAAYWKNRDSYQAFGDKFVIAFAVGAGRPATWEGVQIDAKVPPGPNWLSRNWTGLIAFLATAAAVIGHFEKIRDFSGTLVLSPAVEVAAERADIDILANDEFDCEFTLRNTSEWVTCRITFESVTTDQPTLVNVEGAAPGPFLGLKPGAAEKFKLHGVAYEPTYGGASGEQTPQVAFVFHGTASTWIRREKVLPVPQPQRLHVWPRRTVGEKRRGKVERDGKLCQVVIRFMVGDELANGFDARAILARASDVRFDALLQFPGNAKLEHPGEDTDEIAVGTWEAPAVTARKPYRFYLYLVASRPRSEEEWDDIVRKIEIMFGSKKPGK
jgi:hypothetical protein